MNRALIIVPHGDDEILGFFGAIKHHLYKGDEVSVLFTICPRDQRTKNQFDMTREVHKQLKYHKIFHLTDFNEHNFHSKKLELVEQIEHHIKKHQNNIVYTTHWGDNHQTHKTCFEVVSTAIRVIGATNVSEFYTGEIISSTDQSPNIPNYMFMPNRYIVLSEKDIQEKIDLLKIYTQEYRNAPHPRSEHGIKAVAQYRGLQCNSMYAEAYCCIRNITNK